MKGQFTKASIEWQMMADFFQLVKDHYVVEDTLEYWTSMTNACTEFGRKYGVTSSVGKQADRPAALAQALAHAMIDYAEGQK